MLISLNKRINERSVVCFLFYLCMISNYALDLSKELYTIGKVFFALFIILTLGILILRRDVELNKLCLPFLFLLFLSASYLWAEDKNEVLLGITSQVQYYLLVIAVFNAVRKYNLQADFLYTIILSSYLLAFLTLIKYGGIANYIGLMISGTRLGGLIGNENIFGMTFASSSVICFYFTIDHDYKHKVFYMFSLTLFSFFAFSSQSKKAILMIAIGVVLLCIFHFGIRKIWKTLLLVLLLFVLLYLTLQLKVFSGMTQRLESFLSGADDSDLTRNYLILLGLSLFKQKPFLGWGYCNFRPVSGMPFYSHNNIVELLVDLGIVGFLLYYMLFLKLMIAVNKLRRSSRNSIYEVFLSLLIVDCIMGYGAVQFVEKTPWILFAVCLAVSEKKLNMKNNDHNVMNGGCGFESETIIQDIRY